MSTIKTEACLPREAVIEGIRLEPIAFCPVCRGEDAATDDHLCPYCNHGLVRRDDQGWAALAAAVLGELAVE